MSFQFGEVVEANYQSKGTWFRGKIMGVREDKTYDILYDDGDGESNVDAKRVRSVGDKTSVDVEREKEPPTTTPGFQVGQIVYMDCRATKTVQKVKIIKCDHEIGCFDVMLLTTGSTSKGVPLSLLRSEETRSNTKVIQSSKSTANNGLRREGLLQEIDQMLSDFSIAQLQEARVAMRVIADSSS